MPFETKRPEGPTPVFVKPYGKQGKYKALFCFWSGKLTNIITAEKLEELRADASYSVRRAS